MGCDIHLHVEILIQGNWIELYPTDLTTPFRQDVPNSPLANYWYTGRNYSLFGVLADVRTRELAPICEPRGLPEDVTDPVALSLTHLDYHSSSWIRLDEWLSYDFMGLIEHSLWVHTTNPQEIERTRYLLRQGMPITLPWEDNPPEEDQHEWTNIVYHLYAGQYIDDEFTRMVQSLIRYAINNQHDISDIRFVFAFDN